MFTNPAPFSKSKKTSKSWEFESYQNDRLFSPLDGEVIDTGSECGGFIKIEHRVKDENVYSKFCGVGRISVLSGNMVLSLYSTALSIKTLILSALFSHIFFRFWC